MYQITKRSPDGKTYIVTVHSDQGLTDHISACFEISDEEILCVLKILPMNQVIE